MDDSALVPDLPILTSDEAVELEEKQEELQQATVELASLSYQDGWRALAEQMEADIMMFKTGAHIKDIEKQNLADVGQSFVIGQSVATFLQSYLDKVNDAKEAVKEHEQRRERK